MSGAIRLECSLGDRFYIIWEKVNALMCDIRLLVNVVDVDGHRVGRCAARGVIGLSEERCSKCCHLYSCELTVVGSWIASCTCAL